MYTTFSFFVCACVDHEAGRCAFCYEHVLWRSYVAFIILHLSLHHVYSACRGQMIASYCLGLRNGTPKGWQVSDFNIWAAIQLTVLRQGLSLTVFQLNWTVSQAPESICLCIQVQELQMFEAGLRSIHNYSLVFMNFLVSIV